MLFGRFHAYPLWVSIFCRSFLVPRMLVAPLRRDCSTLNTELQGSFRVKGFTWQKNLVGILSGNTPQVSVGLGVIQFSGRIRKDRVQRVDSYEASLCTYARGARLLSCREWPRDLRVINE